MCVILTDSENDLDFSIQTSVYVEVSGYANSPLNTIVFKLQYNWK